MNIEGKRARTHIFAPKHCEFSVPLKAASLQFVLGHPAIPTNIPGVRTVAQLEDNLRTFRAEIPAEFWAELKRRELIREDAPTPQ